MWRSPLSIDADIAADVDDSTTIPIDTRTGGSLQLPDDSTTTEITIYSKLGSNGWGVARDEDGQELVRPVAAGKPQGLPPAIHGFPQIRIVASEGGATLAVPVFFKT